MTPSKKAAALAAGLAALMLPTAFGPRLAAQGPKGGSETLVVDDATVDWIEKANVAAQREGVIDRMELKIGDVAASNKPIGYLHSEMAVLAVRKAEIAAKSIGPREKANAQKELAVSVVARNTRLNSRIPGSVSPEEAAKAEAELKVAEAAIVEARERTELDKAELDLAKRALEEHTIRAPFDGVVIERIKHPGERVGANESVVKLGNLSRLRAFAYVPIEYAYSVKEGQVVEIQPRLVGERHNPLPIEQKRFRGKISFVDPQLQPVGESAVRVYAEFENKEFELRPGLKATMTIYLNSAPGAAAAPAPAVGSLPSGGVGR